MTRFAKRGFIERIKRQDFLQILKAVEQRVYEITACSTQYS